MSHSPLYVDILLYAIYTLLAAGVLLAVWSVVRTALISRQSGGDGDSHGVPARRIALFTGAVVVATLAATWLTADTKPLKAGRHLFGDVFWLHVSDMLINTMLVLLLLLVVACVWAAIRMWREVNQ